MFKGKLGMQGEGMKKYWHVKSIDVLYVSNNQKDKKGEWSS